MTTPLITQDYHVLTPAYGRDYKSRAEAEADFRAGKDFLLGTRMFLLGGTYTSIRDFAPGTKVNLRYKRLTTICTITV